MRLVALAIALGLPAVAHAAQYTFGLNSATIGGCTTSGAGKSCTLTSGSETINMRVSAWSTSSTSSSATVQDAALGVHAQGLGVVADGESSNSPHHTVDNQTNRDFLIFRFDRAVDLISATFTPYSFGNGQYDMDFTVGSGTLAGAWNAQPALNGTPFSGLSSTFGNGIATYGTNGSTASAAALVDRALDPSNLVGVGNVWFIGASMLTGSPDDKTDGFKLSSLTVRTVPPVPEPASWLMLITGFGLAGAGLRRARAGRTLVAA